MNYCSFPLKISSSQPRLLSSRGSEERGSVGSKGRFVQPLKKTALIPSMNIVESEVNLLMERWIWMRSIPLSPRLARGSVAHLDSCRVWEAFSLLSLVTLPAKPNLIMISPNPFIDEGRKDHNGLPLSLSYSARKGELYPPRGCWRGQITTFTAGRRFVGREGQAAPSRARDIPGRGILILAKIK